LAPIHPSTRLVSVLLSASLALLLSASCALAGTPATVTVRVLGPAPNYESLTPPTTVTTTATPVTKDGGSCSGTSAAGALELATKGDWEGTWSSEFNDYEVAGIDGQAHPFEGPAPYWSFWLNNVEAPEGICEAELEAGDQVLFFPESLPAGCFTEPKGECVVPNLLSLQAPTTAEIDQPVTVTVRSYPYGSSTATAAAGVTVSGGGTSATTNAQGQAQLTFSGDGTYTLRASGAAGEEPRAVPGEAVICAHKGDDGTCGTAAGGGLVTPQTPASDIPPLVPYTGPYALVTALTGIREGHVFARQDAPRVLSGTVSTHSSVTSIALRLRRGYHGRCWAYSGSRERFLKARCGQGSFFHIASGGDAFSYLLPARLPAGRYVLDVQATDSAGNRTKLARGSSRIVFYVR
jgi:hypothetical protein